MKSKLLTCIIVAGFATNIFATIPTPKGLWKFDDSNDLYKATIGAPLVPTSAGKFTFTNGPINGNGAIQTAKGEGLAMSHGLTTSNLYDYTIQWDIKFDNLTNWKCLIQTGAMNDGDGDLFIQPTLGGIGVPTLNWSTATLDVGKWYRVVECVSAGKSAKIYVDGQLYVEENVININNCFTLQAIAHLFGDDYNENDPMSCSEVALWDVALSADQVLKLGTVANSTSAVHNIYANKTLDLSQNFPNPFTNITTFNYQVNDNSNVIFKVLDTTGKEIKVLNEGTKTTGNYSISISSESLNNGIYYVQMLTNYSTSTRKIVVANKL
jgi:hypothetical protein